jgi:hypothetical protein
MDKSPGVWRGVLRYVAWIVAGFALAALVVMAMVILPFAFTNV